MRPLRKLLLNQEDDYLGSVLAITLTKLCLKLKKELKLKDANQMSVDTVLAICALLRLFQQKKSDGDSKQRMQICLKVLT